MLDSLTGLPGYNRESFIEVHKLQEQITSIRTNPPKSVSLPEFGTTLSKVPWCETGYYLSKRPSFTFDPLFHAGCYYVQEASSMFLEQALKQHVDLTGSIRILDLCAAPGGKSTHIQSLISKQSLLVTNEVIRTRVNVLRDNIIKWGCENAVVTSNDPKDFGALENYFDVIVIDAPCSGSGLFRREPDAIDTWSENNVALCSQRQQRILFDVLPALRPGGLLVYSTCSYSAEEDEQICEWLSNEFPLEPLSIRIDPSWNIIGTKKGYRFWPDKLKGEGFFLCAFQKSNGSEVLPTKRTSKKITTLSKNELEIVSKWIEPGGHFFMKNRETVHTWPSSLTDDITYLLGKMKVVYAGLRIGELLKDKLVPDHALAMSNLLSGKIERSDLTRELAIQYLQRKPIELSNAPKGWQAVAFEGNTLGWVNVLQTRVNNYYPKELRILKETQSESD